VRFFNSLEVTRLERIEGASARAEPPPAADAVDPDEPPF
jgi:hypothetical protein